MPTRPQSPTFKAFVLLVCTAWFGVLIAALWGLDWRWIPTTLIGAAALLLVGGYVEVQRERRAERRDAERQFDELLNAWETTLLPPDLSDAPLGKDQPR